MEFGLVWMLFIIYGGCILIVTGNGKERNYANDITFKDLWKKGEKERSREHMNDINEMEDCWKFFN